MKFTLSWLKHHLETDASVTEIADALTDLGLEVEGIENPAEKLADFTIGKVVSAEKHPDADKLRVCQVETKDGMTQIICGAPNARAGITVVIASPGTYDQKHINRIGKLKNCIAYGPGVLELAHKPDEWIGVTDMQDSARVMGRALLTLLAPPA